MAVIPEDTFCETLQRYLCFEGHFSIVIYRQNLSNCPLISYQIDVLWIIILLLPSGVLIYVNEPIETLFVEMVPREAVD